MGVRKLPTLIAREILSLTVFLAMIISTIRQRSIPSLREKLCGCCMNSAESQKGFSWVQPFDRLTLLHIFAEKTGAKQIPMTQPVTRMKLPWRRKPGEGLGNPRIAPRGGACFGLYTLRTHQLPHMGTHAFPQGLQVVAAFQCRNQSAPAASFG
jgi:hypothetical protein